MRLTAVIVGVPLIMLTERYQELQKARKFRSK